jgi:uncharacterized Tic20 family protein
MSDYSSPILDYETTDLDPTQDEKNVALLSHVLTLLVSFIAPLVIYLVKKDESEYIRHHAVESLNFQISLFLYMLLSIPLMLIIIGVFMAMAVGFLGLIFVIVATIKASEGKTYRYPLTIRFVK